VFEKSAQENILTLTASINEQCTYYVTRNLTMLIGQLLSLFSDKGKVVPVLFFSLSTMPWRRIGGVDV
jgi:hypothetical protein